MDKAQHKIAMEFFRSEIKKLSKRLVYNKNAIRCNQRIASKKLEDPLTEYDKSGMAYKYYVPESIIYVDKENITALHIVYGELRGKSHLPEEKKDKYESLCKVVTKRMEEYISEKQVALVLNGASCSGGI